MSFCSFSQDYKKNTVTSVDNNFIYDYLPLADGVEIKVYLATLLFASDNRDCSLDAFAEFLSLTTDEIISSYRFWEQYDLIKITSLDPFTILINDVPKLSTKPTKIRLEKYSDFTSSLQALIPQRMISVNEYSQYFQIMENNKISPEALLMIIKYCVDLKGNDIGYRYILTVIKDFISRGLTTFDSIDNELSQYVLQSSNVAKVISSLGLKRKVEIEDVRLYDKWTKSFGFSLDSIFFAVKSLKKAKIEKLDSFLTDLYTYKLFSIDEIKNYLERKDFLYNLTLKINKAISVYYEIIDTEIDTYTSVWVNMGFDEQTLLFLAQYCFKSGKRKIAFMDELIKTLYQKGVVSLESVISYFEALNKENDYIIKLFNLSGITRTPVQWDRDNLSAWKSWGFNEVMIEKAFSMSQGKTNPVSYVNTILSDWKNKGIFSTDKIPAISEPKTNSAVNFENQREYSQEYFDSLITKISEIKI